MGRYRTGSSNSRGRCWRQFRMWFQLHQSKHGIFSRRRIFTAESGKGDIHQSFLYEFLVFSLRRYAWQGVCEKVFKKCRKNGESIVKTCSHRLLKYSKSWPRKKSLNHRTQRTHFQRALCFKFPAVRIGETR